MENSSGNWKERLRLWIKKQLSLLTAACAVIIGFLGNPIKAYAALVGSEPNPLSDLEPIVANIISSSVAIAGIALFAMLVFGGVMYTSSGGNPESIQKAKSILTYAIAGIALLVIAWFVLLFIKTFTGVDVTTFTVPSP